MFTNISRRAVYRGNYHIEDAHVQGPHRGWKKRKKVAIAPVDAGNALQEGRVNRSILQNLREWAGFVNQGEEVCSWVQLPDCGKHLFTASRRDDPIVNQGSSHPISPLPVDFS